VATTAGHCPESGVSDETRTILNPGMLIGVVFFWSGFWVCFSNHEAGAPSSRVGSKAVPAISTS
jgi:hypothetical protein